MHSDIRRGIDMLGAVTVFETAYPLLPPNARAAALFAEVRQAHGDIRAMGNSQDSNRNKFLSGTSQRRQIAGEMRTLMRQIAYRFVDLTVVTLILSALVGG